MNKVNSVQPCFKWFIIVHNLFYWIFFKKEIRLEFQPQKKKKNLFMLLYTVILDFSLPPK